jgi:NosR/NirI family transcriptional regulator, nitrous oxide reductase regulator
MRFAFLRILALLVALLAASAPAGAAGAGQSYEASLPPQLASDPALCAWVPCQDVMPGADSFSPRKGRPPYVEAYRTQGGQRTLLGYVFLSTDIVDIPGYSGKPIVTLIGMDTRGLITDVKVLRHSEPILLLGIPESALARFIHQYVGRFAGARLEIGKAADDGVGLDAISGATVTVIAENQVILRSAKEVARQVGILKPTVRPQARFALTEAALDWQAMLDEGSVRRLTVQPQDLGRAPDGRPVIDLFFGDLGAPAVGRSILGESGWQALRARLQPGEHAIFVIASGSDSFKGSGFVRGGIFDRIQVAQDDDTFTFRDVDYQNLYDVKAPGAPAYRESGIFIVRSAAFSQAYPWNLVFLANRVDPQTGAKSFASFEQEYWLPARYLEGGRPAWQRPAPAWLKVWQARGIEIALFVLLLAAGGTTYALRDRLVRRSSRKDKRWVSVPKYALWLASIAYAGFWLKAQPSITQVLTWFHEIVFEWEWSLFLSDPFVFIFWWFIILSVFFWGRGMFCGWLCPYGALSEITHRVGRAIGLGRWQRKLPQRLHDRLKWVKYGVFAGLLGVSFYSMPLAEKLAEIEPFKTTFLVGVLNRSWPFITFWGLLLAAALFIERPFCKYLCPLGASLAIPSTFRWWGLQRKQECGPCTACATGCHAQAIDHKTGRIDQRECLLCLDCMVMYYDDHSCPPLARERKARTSAGLALTPIGANGYFIPIRPEPAAPAALPDEPAPDPARGLLAWLAAEAIDHLFPWNGRFLQQPLFFRAAGIGLALLVTWAWLLGAAGKLGAGMIVGWWLAWSAYELVTRMKCKPRVKEGPWWGRTLRPANWPDMAAYVGMKNLLIGAALFLAMQAGGALQVLHGVPQLAWLYR